MIVLNSLTRSLKIVLAGAKNTNDCPFVASYTDEPNSPAVGGATAVAASNPGNTNGVTAVTIMDAPPGYPNYSRKLKSFNLNNADLAAVTLSIQYVDSAGSTYVLAKYTLQTLEQLSYEDGYGFEVLTPDGAVKSQAAATSSATSTAQATASAASVSISSLAAAVNPTSVNSTSSQASSLAAAIVPASVNSVSSQASSMAALNPNTVSSLQSAASVQSFTSTNWATVSSAASRVKSSFSW